MGLARVVGAILLIAMLHHPGPAYSVVLPDSYSVTLKWDRSPSPEVTGYRIYYGTAAGSYSNSVMVGNMTTNTILGLLNGVTYFIAVTAHNAGGVESLFSNEITFVPGLPKLQIRVASNRQAILTVTGQIGHTYEIQAAADVKTWVVIGTVTLGASGSASYTNTNAGSFPKRFYRTRDTQP